MDFTYTGFWWQADVAFGAWSDFIQGDDIPLIFAPEGRDEAPMDASEGALVNWAKDNQVDQKSPLLRAILEAYPDFRRNYFEDYDIEETEDDLPTIVAEADLAKVMELQEIYVHQISKDGLPYVGYKFSCRWDEEHGLGVLLHNNRVVEMGGGDTAFLLWIAEDDRDS